MGRRECGKYPSAVVVRLVSIHSYHNSIAAAQEEGRLEYEPKPNSRSRSSREEKRSQLIVTCHHLSSFSVTVKGKASNNF
jgi:hypothetical protein